MTPDFSIEGLNLVLTELLCHPNVQVHDYEFEKKIYQKIPK